MNTLLGSRQGGYAYRCAIMASVCACLYFVPSVHAIVLETTNDAVLIESREKALIEGANVGVPTPSTMRRSVTGVVSLTEWGPEDTNVLMTMRDCIVMGLERNLGLVINRFDPAISREMVRGAWSVFDPNFNMAFLYNGSKNPRPYEKEGPAGNFKNVMGNSRNDQVDFNGGFTGVLPTGMKYDLQMGQGHSVSEPGGGFYNPSYSTYNNGALSIPVLKNFGIGVNMAPIRIARNNWHISRVTLDASIQDLIMSITEAYWTLYFYREDLSAQEYTLYLNRELLKVNEAKVKVGMAAPLDVTQAKATIANQENTVLIARNKVLDSEDKLRQIVNYEMNDLYQPKALRRPRYHLVPLEKPLVVEIAEDETYFVQIALNNEQTIEIAKFQLKNASENLKVAKNNLLPEVNLVGSLGFQGLGDDYGHSYDDQGSGQHPNWSLGVEFNMPLLYLEPVSTYRQSKYAQRQAEVNIEQVKQTVAIQVRTALRAVETNRKRIDATREGSTFAREQLDAEQEKFKVGQSTTFDVLFYQNQLATALRNEIQALSEWRVSVTRLYRSTGRILTDGGIVIEEYATMPDPANTLADKIWN